MAESKGTLIPRERADTVVKPALQATRLLAEDLGEVFPESGERSLYQWLMRLEQGSSLDVRSKLFNGRPRKGIMDTYMSMMAKDPVTGSNVPWFVKEFTSWESEHAEKVGPMSEFLPYSEDGPKKALEVWSDKPPLPRLKLNALEAALSDVARLLPPHSISPITVEEAISGIKDKPETALDHSTSSCAFTYVHKWKDAKAIADGDPRRVFAYETIVKQANQVWSTAGAAKDYRDTPPRFEAATVSQRTNSMHGMDPLHNIKTKRLVIAMPKGWNTVPGKTVMTPIQRELSGVVNPITGFPVILGWQPKAKLDKGVNEMLRFANRRGYTVLSGDISGFDKSLPPWLMWKVAQAISTWLDRKAANIFLAIIHADIYGTYLIQPTGILQPTPSSVKSGSIWTALIGCMANYCIQRYGMHAGYYKISISHVMGDDFLCVGPGVEPESMQEAFADFGMDCNADKQFYVPGLCNFLQRFYELDVPGGIFSSARTLGQCLSNEDDDTAKDSKDAFSSWGQTFRWLHKVDNCCFNPYFKILVDYVKVGDSKNHLGQGTPTNVIPKLAGSSAERYVELSKVKVWRDTGIAFSDWLVNRVVRGEKLEPRGFLRFRQAYGEEYDAVKPKADIIRKDTAQYVDK